MTVCIAATCRWNYASVGEPNDWGYAVVTAHDLMMTDEGLNLEYEHTVKKCVSLTRHTQILMSGNTALHTGVILREFAPFDNDTSPIVFAQEYAKQYRDHIAEEAAQFHLSPFGLTLERFVAGDHGFDPTVQRDLADKLSTYATDLKTDVLIAGATRVRGYIVYMNKYGILTPLDDIGFAAIGAGGDHAIGYLTQTRHKRDDSLWDVVWRVYCAKRRAEIAPGVGDATAMSVVTANEVFDLEHTRIEAMRARYEELKEQAKYDDSAAARMVAEIGVSQPTLLEDDRLDEEEVDQGPRVGSEAPLPSDREGDDTKPLLEGDGSEAASLGPRKAKQEKR